jgi:hypothetical protein
VAGVGAERTPTGRAVALWLSGRGGLVPATRGAWAGQYVASKVSHDHGSGQERELGGGGHGARWPCASREEWAEDYYIGKRVCRGGASLRREGNPGVNAMYGGRTSACAHAQGGTRRTGG